MFLFFLLYLMYVLDKDFDVVFDILWVKIFIDIVKIIGVEFLKDYIDFIKLLFRCS